MDDADAMSSSVARGVEVDHVAIQRDDSSVGALDSGQDTHERGLASTVLPDQHVDGIAMQFEVDVVQSNVAGVTLENATSFENDVAHAGVPCSLARSTASCHFEKRS